MRNRWVLAVVSPETADSPGMYTTLDSAERAAGAGAPKLRRHRVQGVAGAPPFTEIGIVPVNRDQ